MREHEIKGPGVLEIGYSILFNEGLVENQKTFSTTVLGKTPSYYSSMLARRRTPTLFVVRRLRDHVQKLLMGFVGNPHLGSKYALELNKRHRKLATLLNTIEDEVRLREAITGRIELPELVYNRYNPIEALFRIAEIFTVLGISRDDRDFSVLALDMQTDFLAALGTGTKTSIPASAAESLKSCLEDRRDLEAKDLADVSNKQELWRARYNMLQLSLDLFGSFIQRKAALPTKV